jgi:hypothetical protein
VVRPLLNAPFSLPLHIILQCFQTNSLSLLPILIIFLAAFFAVRHLQESFANVKMTVIANAGAFSGMWRSQFWPAM